MKENFKNYVYQYDMSDINIVRKYYHSYRVMDLCMLLAKYNNFSEENTLIAMLVGLLHDYGRFEQWTKYKTYKDSISIDHADLAVLKLFDNNEIKNYCLQKEYYDEIYDAIKYHNKYEIPSNLSDHNTLLCKVIRDADKLDIFYLISMYKDLLEEDDNSISEKVKTDFFNNKAINLSDLNNKSDAVILKLGMVFDLNFKYSFEHLKNTKVIDKIFDNIINKDKFKIYFEYINKYIDERI